MVSCERKNQSKWWSSLKWNQFHDRKVLVEISYSILKSRENIVCGKHYPWRIVKEIAFSFNKRITVFGIFISQLFCNFEEKDWWSFFAFI